jgi:predicted transposase YbfD/YdcC
MIESERIIEDKPEKQTRFYISSLENNAEMILNARRSHWGIENSLPWSLDMVFNEDHSRVRKDNAPQNFSIIRQLTLNLLKQELSPKVGIKAK